MRWLGGLLVGAALSVVASAAGAQTPAPAPSAGPTAGLSALTLAPADDPDSEYDSTKHGGLSYGTWLTATRGTARRSTGMMITGIGLLGLGVALMGAGTGIYAHTETCTRGNTIDTPPTPSPGFSGESEGGCGPVTGHATGMALLIAGTLGVGLAIPLIALGASEVPRAEAGSLAPSHPGGGAPVATATRLTLALGLRGAGFALHF
jgi:hypothetical protein